MNLIEKEFSVAKTLGMDKSFFFFRIFTGKINQNNSLIRIK